MQLNKTCRTCHRWPKKWVTGLKKKPFQWSHNVTSRWLVGAHLVGDLASKFFVLRFKITKVLFSSVRLEVARLLRSGASVIFREFVESQNLLVREIAVNI